MSTSRENQIKEENKKQAENATEGNRSYVMGIMLYFVDSAWRAIRYTNILGAVHAPLLAGIADILDTIGLFLINIPNFIRNAEKNLADFWNDVFVPTLYIVISALTSSGVVGFGMVKAAILHGSMFSVLGGLLGMAGRLLVQTLSRFISFMKILAVGKEKHLTQQEKHLVREDIHKKMEPMSSVMLTAGLMIGGLGLAIKVLSALGVAISVGVATGGIGYIVAGSILIGVVLVRKIYTSLLKNCPAFKAKVDQFKSWYRRHEPYVIKEAKARVSNAFHRVRNAIFGKKQKAEFTLENYNTQLEQNYNVTKELKEKRKNSSWSEIDARLGEARRQLPRDKSQIISDIVAARDKLAANPNIDKEGTKEYYKANLLSKLNVVVKEHGYKNKEKIKEKIDELDEIYKENKKAFPSFTFGKGRLASLFHETKAMYEENIERDIADYANKNAYGKLLSSEVYNNREQISDPKFNPDTVYSATRNTKLDSINNLLLLNKAVDRFNSSDSEDAQARQEIEDQINFLRTNADFKKSQLMNGERFKIYQKIMNKYDRAQYVRLENIAATI